jgi:hypothetical protein
MEETREVGGLRMEMEEPRKVENEIVQDKEEIISDDDKEDEKTKVET